ncbi:MAG: zinc-binding dehydrogenase [Candidatus Latescibacteria bacterium]|jgi:L-iditol 2-dehydrogenase|nr:zinc-binding dehydrogenase [Candidatus Latescibacterota bacterium]
MKRAAMFGDGKAGLAECPTPVSKNDLVLVKVHSVPMCTEYKAFKDGYAGEGFGHEASGEVVEVAQPGMVKVGDRVAVMPQYPCGKCALCLDGEYIHCQNVVDVHAATGNTTGTHTYAEYLIKQDWLVIPIPEDISYDHGAMACCGLGPTFGAMQQMNVTALDTVLITGMGPVGLGGVINAVHRRARVIVAEIHPYRAQLARDLGAEAVIDPRDDDAAAQILDLTGGIGVDKAIDCSGAAPAQRLMIDAVRRKGQACFVGQSGDLTIGVSRDMIGKGLTLRGAWHYNRADTPKIMQIIRDSAALLECFITHTFPMKDVQTAWELQTTGECGKVILNP